jgi:hypothetical protein
LLARPASALPAEMPVSFSDWSARQLTDSKRKHRINDNCQIIEFADAIGPDLAIFFYDDKIKPTLGPPACLYSVGKVNKKCHREECSKEENRLKYPKQEIVAGHKAQNYEYLQKLVPLRLQGMRFDEAQIMLDFIQ